jgi:hypothetical protein
MEDKPVLNPLEPKAITIDTKASEVLPAPSAPPASVPGYVAPASINTGNIDPRFANELTNRPLNLPDLDRQLSPGVTFPTLYRNDAVERNYRSTVNFGNQQLDAAQGYLTSTLNEVQREEDARLAQLRANTAMVQKQIDAVRQEGNTGLAAFLFGSKPDYSTNRQVNFGQGQFGEQGGGLFGLLGYTLGGISSSVNALNADLFQRINPSDPGKAFTAGNDAARQLTAGLVSVGASYQGRGRSFIGLSPSKVLSTFVNFTRSVEQLRELDKDPTPSVAGSLPKSLAAFVGALLPTNWAVGLNPFVNKPALNNRVANKGLATNVADVWRDGRKYEDTNNPFTSDGLFYDAKRTIVKTGVYELKGKVVPKGTPGANERLNDNYSLGQKVASGLWNALANPGDTISDALIIDRVLKPVIGGVAKRAWSALPFRKQVINELAQELPKGVEGLGSIARVPKELEPQIPKLNLKSPEKIVAPHYAPQAVKEAGLRLSEVSSEGVVFQRVKPIAPIKVAPVVAEGDVAVIWRKIELENAAALPYPAKASDLVKPVYITPPKNNYPSTIEDLLKPLVTQVIEEPSALPFATYKETVGKILDAAGFPINDLANARTPETIDAIIKATGANDLLELTLRTPYAERVAKKYVRVRNGLLQESVQYPTPFPDFTLESLPLSKAQLLGVPDHLVNYVGKTKKAPSAIDSPAFYNNIKLGVAELSRATKLDEETVTKYINGGVITKPAKQKLDKHLLRVAKAKAKAAIVKSVDTVAENATKLDVSRQTLEDVSKERPPSVAAIETRIEADVVAPKTGIEDSVGLVNATNSVLARVNDNTPLGELGTSYTPTLSKLPDVVPPASKAEDIVTPILVEPLKKAEGTVKKARKSRVKVQQAIASDVATGKIDESNVASVTKAIESALAAPESTVIKTPKRGKKKTPASAIVNGDDSAPDVVINLSATELGALEQQANAVRTALNLSDEFDILPTTNATLVSLKGAPEVTVKITNEGLEAVIEGQTVKAFEVSNAKISELLELAGSNAKQFDAVDPIEALPSNIADLVDDLEVAVPLPVKVTEAVVVGNDKIPGTTKVIPTVLHGVVLRSDESLLTNVIDITKGLGMFQYGIDDLGVPTRFGMMTLKELGGLPKQSLSAVLEDLQKVQQEVINGLDTLNNANYPSVAIPNLGDSAIAEELRNFTFDVFPNRPTSALATIPPKVLEERVFTNGSELGFHGTSVDNWVPVRDIGTEAINRLGFGTYITPNYGYASAASNKIADNTLDMTLAMGQPTVHVVKMKPGVTGKFISTESKIPQRAIKEFFEAVLPEDLSVGRSFNGGVALYLDKVYDKLIDISITNGVLDERKSRFMLGAMDEYIKRIGFDGILDHATQGVKVINTEILDSLPIASTKLNPLDKVALAMSALNKEIVEQVSMFGNKLDFSRSVDNRFELLKQVNATFDDYIRKAFDVRVATTQVDNVVDDVYYGNNAARSAESALTDDVEYVDDLQSLGAKVDLDNPCDY